MSDFEGSDAPSSRPSDATLEKALRDAVRTLWKTSRENLSVKKARTAAEKALKLQEDFYKSDATWNVKSKNIATEEVDKLEDEGDKSKLLSPEVPKKPSSPAPKKPSKPAKPASPEEDSPPKKRRKKEAGTSSDDQLSLAPSDFSEEEKPKPKSAPKPKKAAGGSEEAKSRTKKSSNPSIKLDKVVAEDESDGGAKPVKVDGAPIVASDSELSEVLEDEPKPKKKRKLSDPSSSIKPAKKKVAPAKAKDSGLDPDETEIKRLQGWLVKCGIRKIWAIELKPYDTAKAKIKHLKQMLEDVGMTGRYSQEKASEIKERRELEADLEAVKAGAQRWGREHGDEDDDGDSRPRRRLVKGAKALDFLGDSDGEETD